VKKRKRKKKIKRAENIVGVDLNQSLQETVKKNKKKVKKIKRKDLGQEIHAQNQNKKKEDLLSLIHQNQNLIQETNKRKREVLSQRKNNKAKIKVKIKQNKENNNKIVIKIIKIKI
jgi:hypothetical protein